MTAVVATLVVPFGASAVAAGGSLVAEWDDTMNVVVDGKVVSRWVSGGTVYFAVMRGNIIRIVEGKDVKPAFLPGDTVYLLVHTDPARVRVVEINATSGTIIRDPLPVVQNREDELFFPVEGGAAQGLQYLPHGPLALTWYGNRATKTQQSGRELAVLTGKFPCLCKAAYPVRFTRYRLKTPTMTLGKDDTFPIALAITYEEIIP
jgi:hypothetical protein